MLLINVQFVRLGLAFLACLAFALYALVPSELYWTDTDLFGEPLQPLQKLARKRASPDGEIVLFFANSGFIGHLVNAVCSLRAQGNEHFVVATVDESMTQICEDLGLPCAPSIVGFQQEADAMDFQSTGYYAIVQSKTSQVEALLKLGLHVLFSDSDIYFLQDPLKTDLPCRDDRCHIAMSTNRPDVPPEWQWGNWNFNSGFYYVRSSPLMLAEWTNIKQAIRESGELEQPPFNAVLCGLYGEMRNTEEDLCINPDQVKTAMLDPTRFVISASDRLEPEKVEPLWEWHSIPRDLVTIHLAWLGGESAKMGTWRRNGMVSFNSTDYTCLPFLGEARVGANGRRREGSVGRLSPGQGR